MHRTGRHRRPLSRKPGTSRRASSRSCQRYLDPIYRHPSSVARRHRHRCLAHTRRQPRDREGAAVLPCSAFRIRTSFDSMPRTDSPGCRTHPERIGPRRTRGAHGAMCRVWSTGSRRCGVLPEVRNPRPRTATALPGLRGRARAGRTILRDLRSRDRRRGYAAAGCVRRYAVSPAEAPGRPTEPTGGAAPASASSRAGVWLVMAGGIAALCSTLVGWGFTRGFPYFSWMGPSSWRWAVEGLIETTRSPQAWMIRGLPWSYVAVILCVVAAVLAVARGSGGSGRAPSSSSGSALSPWSCWGPTTSSSCTPTTSRGSTGTTPDWATSSASLARCSSSSEARGWSPLRASHQLPGAEREGAGLLRPRRSTRPESSSRRSSWLWCSGESGSLPPAAPWRARLTACRRSPACTASLWRASEPLTENGIGWVTQWSATTTTLLDVSFADSQHGWAVGGTDDGGTGIILATSDGGLTWEIQYADGGFGTLNAVFAVDARTCWAVGYGGVVLMTSDGGDTWDSSTLAQSQSDRHHLRRREPRLVCGLHEHRGIRRLLHHWTTAARRGAR